MLECATSLAFKEWRSSRNTKLLDGFLSRRKDKTYRGQVHNYTEDLLSREGNRKKPRQEKKDSVRVRVMNRQNQDSHQAEISGKGKLFLIRGKNFLAELVCVVLFAKLCR